MGYPNITQDIQELERKKVNLSDLINLIYPVGSIYMSANNVSPATFLGGTWEQIKDTFLLCSGDTYSAGNTGGEAYHNLSIDEIPSHTHTRGTMDITGHVRCYSSYNKNNASFVTNGVSGAFYWQTEWDDDTSKALATTQNVSSGTADTIRNIPFQASRAWTGATSSVGANQAHNNMPPYLTVYCWKRIA
jgi:microcystin-dependent protein